MLKPKLTPEIKLLHLPDLDAIVAMRQDESSLTILDIVASRIPPVDEIVSAIDFGGRQVEVYLTPERLSRQPEESYPVDNG